MEKLLSAILKLIESKSVHTILIHFLVMATIVWVLAQAGFPVVDYTEKAVAKLQEHPKLAGGLFGGLVSLLWWFLLYSRLFKSIPRMMVKDLALSLCYFGLLSCCYLLSVLLTISAVAWLVS